MLNIKIINLSKINYQFHNDKSAKDSRKNGLKKKVTKNRKCLQNRL